MSNKAITYLVGACAGVFGLTAFCALVIVPALTAYRRVLERVAVVILSLYVLAALVVARASTIAVVAASHGARRKKRRTKDVCMALISGSPRT